MIYSWIVPVLFALIALGCFGDLGVAKLRGVRRHKPSRMSVDELEIWHHEWRMKHDPEYAEVFGGKEREPRSIERWDMPCLTVDEAVGCIAHGGPDCVCGEGPHRLRYVEPECHAMCACDKCCEPNWK